MQDRVAPGRPGKKRAIYTKQSRLTRGRSLAPGSQLDGQPKPEMYQLKGPGVGLPMEVVVAEVC